MASIAAPVPLTVGGIEHIVRTNAACAIMAIVHASSPPVLLRVTGSWHTPATLLATVRFGLTDALLWLARTAQFFELYGAPDSSASGDLPAECASEEDCARALDMVRVAFEQSALRQTVFDMVSGSAAHTPTVWAADRIGVVHVAAALRALVPLVQQPPEELILFVRSLAASVSPVQRAEAAWLMYPLAVHLKRMQQAQSAAALSSASGSSSATLVGSASSAVAAATAAAAVAASGASASSSKRRPAAMPRQGSLTSVTSGVVPAGAGLSGGSTSSGTPGTGGGTGGTGSSTGTLPPPPSNFNAAEVRTALLSTLRLLSADDSECVRRVSMISLALLLDTQYGVSPLMAALLRLGSAPGSTSDVRPHPSEQRNAELGFLLRDITCRPLDLLRVGVNFTALRPIINPLVHLLNALVADPTLPSVLVGLARLAVVQLNPQGY